MEQSVFFIYILFCSNQTFYTGYTTDIHRRFQEHLEGTNKCKYTRSFKPLGIAQCWRTLGNKNEAMKIERHIKKLSKKQKEYLVTFPQELEKLFSCEHFYIQMLSDFSLAQPSSNST